MKIKGSQHALKWAADHLVFKGQTIILLHVLQEQTIVHRDLKPGNILIYQNYLSKLVPEVAENVTQCHVTTTAGTLYHIDLEYQQARMLGVNYQQAVMLGVKPDVYSFGILLLELLTAKRPTSLAYNVEQAMDQGTFKDMLDSAVHKWQALSLAKVALKYAQLSRKDRPNLGK